MNLMNITDPGFDYEVQEMEEWLYPISNIPQGEWVSPSKNVSPETITLPVLIASPGKASKLLGKMIKLKELISFLVFNSFEQKRLDHGYEKGIALYKCDGFYLVLCGATIEPQLVNSISESIINLCSSAPHIFIYNLEQGSEDDLSCPISLKTCALGYDKLPSFTTITGFPASLFTMLEISGKKAELLSILQNGLVLKSIESSFANLALTIPIKLDISDKIIHSVLFTETAKSLMFM